jgi:hypothetical protein
MGWMPVMLLTGAFEPYDERRASESGADSHMTKPFESRALVSAVEALLAAHPRPGQAAEKAAVQAAPPTQATPPPTAQTLRMKASDLFAQVPPGPAGPAAAATPRTPASNGGAAPPAMMAVPPEVIDRAVREAVAGMSEKIVREVAWEVIPDLAEAIIRRRIRELEDETER